MCVCVCVCVCVTQGYTDINWKDKVERYMTDK